MAKSFERMKRRSAPIPKGDWAGVQFEWSVPTVRDRVVQAAVLLGLKLNRDKTRIVNLRRPEERLEFLGYQIGLAPVRADRRRHYWRMEPSHKAMEREVDRIWEMTSRQHSVRHARGTALLRPNFAYAYLFALLSTLVVTS